LISPVATETEPTTMFPPEEANVTTFLTVALPIVWPTADLPFPTTMCVDVDVNTHSDSPADSINYQKPNKLMQ